MEFVQQYWLALALIALAAVLGARGLWTYQTRKHWSAPLLGFAASLAFAGLGGLTLSPDGAYWLTVAALGTLVTLFLIVVITGTWVATLGYIVGAVLLFGSGGLASEPMTGALGTAGKFLLSVEPLEPLWLLLLLLVPFIVWLSFRSLSGLGPVRRWVAIGLRCLVIASPGARARGNACTQARRKPDGAFRVGPLPEYSTRSRP